MNQNVTHILIVDDEEGIREVLERGLSRSGYLVHTAQDAREAATLLQREPVDLMVLDIKMPGKSGMDFLPEAVDMYPDLAVIMLSGEGDISTAVKTMRGGALDYVMKPVGLSELVVRVEHALTRRSLQLQNRAYQVKMEQMLNELNARLEQRNRELAALNSLFQSHMGQGRPAQDDTLSRMKDSLSVFSSELEGLAAIVGLDPQREPRSARES